MDQSLRGSFSLRRTLCSCELEVGWRLIAQRRVHALAVVERLDVVEDACTRLVEPPVVLVVDELSLQRLDLSFLGMISYTAYTNSIANAALTNAGGTATWAAQIPLLANLVGNRFYLQAGATAPGANAFGVVMSNACELVLGAK